MFEPFQEISKHMSVSCSSLLITMVDSQREVTEVIVAQWLGTLALQSLVVQYCKRKFLCAINLIIIESL